MSGQRPSAHPPPPSFSYQATTTYESPSAPPMLSPQSPSSGHPGMGMLGPQLIGRPDSDGRPQLPQPMQVNNLSDPQHRYGPEYEQMVGSQVHPDHFRLGGMVPASPSVQHTLVGGSIQGHKRAYRQRRKDPSCDACRERKVKCDATDTSSCSECSSRNVKCQFTKETNRRMSSIKQVQDLEKQLHAARQQVNQLRSMVRADSFTMEDEDDSLSDKSGPNKRRKLTATHDFSIIQRNFENYGRGIVRAPTSVEPRGNGPSPPAPTPELPPQHVGEYLFRDYRAMLQPAFPFLHWPTTTHKFDQAYREGSLSSIPSDTAAVIFGIFACGSLREHPEDGKKYFDTARVLMDFWTAAPTMDLIRAAMLCGIFSVETNNRSAGFTLMGFAVRAAQEIGLHHRLATRSVAEEEKRYQLWWSLYCTERFLAYELGRPTMINDEDCDAPDPQYPHSSSGLTQFDFMIQVARTVPHLQRAFKNSVIPPPTLESIEDQINRCMTGMPQHHQLKAVDYLDPGPTGPVVYLQNIRLLLHRHNLNPACSLEVRRMALDNCLAAAQDTARILSRIMQDQPPSTPKTANLSTPPPARWEDTLRSASSAFLCMHIWRCTLFLAACGDYEGALLCAIASQAIGKQRIVNSVCGRYLEFFLSVLSEKGPQDRGQLVQDDEVLAYVSGDLQSNLDQAWIWQTGKVQSPRGFAPNTERNMYRESEVREWDAWPNVIAALRRFQEEQRQRQVPSHGHGSAPPLAPRIDTTVSQQRAQVSPSNRISIKDII